MLSTNFELLHAAGACTSGYRKLAEYLGGIDHYGRDKDIPLTVVLESNGLSDALWCLRATTEPELARQVSIELACRYAEHVLPVWEAKYPADRRPHLAIKAAKKCILENTPENRQAAGAAARDAEWAAVSAAYAASAAAGAADAAWAAARDAADAAAWAAADAAWAAARDAAWAAGDATWAAAWAAAWAAERDWQTEQFRLVLEKGV